MMAKTFGMIALKMYILHCICFSQNEWKKMWFYGRNFLQERRLYWKAGSEAWHVSLTVSSLALALAYIGSGEDDNIVIVTGSCWNCICVDDQLSWLEKLPPPPSPLQRAPQPVAGSLHNCPKTRLLRLKHVILQVNFFFIHMSSERVTNTLIR